MAHAHDKEQIEMLAKWWRDYGRGILVAIIIGLIVGLGWKYWRDHKQAHQANASREYMVLLEYSFANKPVSVEAELIKIKRDYSDTPYAALSSLMVAGNQVTQGKLDQAIKNLQWVTKHSKVNSFKQIAAINLARILVSQKKYPQALEMLDHQYDKSFAPMVLTVKGDIYQAQGNKQKAFDAYSQAQKSYQASGLQDPFLAMKLAE